MIKVILTVGAPACGKSTWAKAEVAKDPSNYVRINNDDLRAMMNGSVWSADYEKMITDTRNYLIRDALKRGKNVIIDNVNANRRHFDDTCKIAKSVNVDVMVMEKSFYEDLEVLLERDAKRTGSAQVGEAVVKKWFKDLGGKGHKHFKPRVEIYQQQKGFASKALEGPANIDGAPEAIICDLDGTLALIHGRSPYDASDCDIKDLPNIPVIETIKAHYNAGRKIIFCSGREDKYRPETIRFIEKYVMITENPQRDRDFVPLPIQYQLFMRKTDDFRKDAIIKEEIYQGEIEGKYNVLCVLDDRDQVVTFWREKGLTCFQVAPGNF
jgi:predicted kinase